MLEPLAPTSRAATILGDGGPSALEVAYKRKGIETEIGKNIAKAEAAKAKAKAADDKNKLEQQKQLDLLPATVNLEHASEFANIYNEQTDKIANILARNGGIVPISGPDGAEYRRAAQTIKQAQSNSEQLNKEMLRQLAVVDSQDPNNPRFLPGAREAIIATYGDPKWLRSGTLPPSVIEDHFDVNGYLEPLFSKIKADQTAYGYVTPEGGTEEGTKKFILRDDIKQVAEMGAADPVAFSAFKRQLSNLSPETQAKIVQIAKDNKITPEAAMALELGIGLVEHVEKTRNVTAPSAAGYGRADKKAAAQELIENTIGVVTGAGRGTLDTMTATEATDYANKFPSETRGFFDREIKNGAKVTTTLRGKVYGNYVDAGGHVHPETVDATILYPNGDVRVVYNAVKVTDSGKTVERKYTERIPEKEVWSRVGIQIAKSDPAYDLGSVEKLFEDEYAGVKDTKAQVDLKGGSPVNLGGGKTQEEIDAEEYAKLTGLSPK